MKKWLFPLLVVGVFVLQGCSTDSVRGDVTVSEDTKEVRVEKQVFTQEITMKIEDELKNANGFTRYIFNGFIGEDTLAFEAPHGHSTYKSYHPAIKGYTFRFQELNEVKNVEIIDFSREKGTVTLKMEVVNE